MTLAEQQATFLRALADHLAAHPALAPVNVNHSWEPGTSLQVASRVGAPVTQADIRAWAESVGADRIHVTLVDDAGKGFLQATGPIGEFRTEVWGAVAGEYTDGQEIPIQGGASDA